MRWLFLFPSLKGGVLTAALALVLLGLTSAPSLAQTPNKDLVRADAALSAVQKRVALVIGNKDYADAPLKNPVNDAESMAAALKDLGFEVILANNVDRRKMQEAVDAFAGKLGPNCIGLFYFSGHGVQVDGINYLVPLNYHIERQGDVEYEAFPAQRVVSAMGESGCTLNIVVLDACRNNPLPKSIRALGDKGLGKMNAPKGTFIAYATAPGQTASDDPDKNNGLYTGVLLQKMKTPGLKIEEVFKATRVSVDAVSKGKQTPWDESSLQNDFYFAAGVPAPNPAPEPAPVVVTGKGSVVDTKGRLAVVVTDSTGAAINGAVVTVDNQAAPNGAFALNLLDEAQKDVTVKVTASGYEGQLLNGVTLLRGKTVSLPVTLAAVVAPMPEPLPTHPPISPVLPPDVNVPTTDGKALLATVIKAHGGDAFLAVKGIKATGKGELTPPGDSPLKMAIDALIVRTAPSSKTRLDMTTNFGPVIVASPGTGKTGWIASGELVQDQVAGDMTSSGDPTFVLRDAAIRNGAVQLIATTEKASDGVGLKAFTVTSAGGRVLTLYVEEGTNLLRRIDSKVKDTSSSILLSDYKSVGGGVQMPGKIVILANGKQILSLTLDTTELNPFVSDSVFEKPKS